MARGDGPYKIVQMVGGNPSKIEFSYDMNIFASFNVRDLSPYIEDEENNIEDLRENSF